MTDGTAPGPVIEIQGLRKTYRSRLRGERTALDGFDMVVERGQVHGFLGPNGSGKTTTLRTLLGLVRADGGRMSLLGRSAPAALPEVMHRVGAIVESPQFFGNFTGRRTLLLLATAGGLPAARVDEVLEQVGLRDRGNDRVRGYSLGMKQRLAVASALLKSPELLILDEPANGLDPAGIREMRDMMRELALAGVTDTMTIISRGRRVVAGPVADVLSRFDRGEFRVKVFDHVRAAAIIAESGLPVTVNDDHFVVSDLADAAWITETLAGHQLWVAELSPLIPDLESVFLQLTGTQPEPGLRRQVDDTVQPPAARPAPVEVGEVRP
jgi:ABC-2 type transport system ATP-binding protein